MKAFLKENFLYILTIILISLIFVLWGRVFVSGIKDVALCENLGTLSSRVACAKSFGWEIDQTSEASERVFIPKEFDDVYKKYNKIQKLSGFDLTSYRGKSAMRYTYRVLNFPAESKEDVFINILVHQGKMIGGDCMTVSLSGFMLPIDRRFID